jgi:hypothetical protein
MTFIQCEDDHKTAFNSKLLLPQLLDRYIMKSADANSYEKSLRANGVVTWGQPLVIHILKQPVQVQILRSADYFQNLIVRLCVFFILVIFLQEFKQCCGSA